MDKLFLLCCYLCGIFLLCASRNDAVECNGAGSCEFGCVAIERVLHRYGLDASSSILVAVPRLTNNYVMCYSRPLGSQKKSHIYCFYSPMDNLAGSQPRLTVTADGFVTRLQVIQVENKQFLAAFAVNRNPVLYEILTRDNSVVLLSNPQELGGMGSTDSSLTVTQHVAIWATSSGRHCKEGDRLCTSPTVAMINGRSSDMKRCLTTDIPPAEFVTSWTHGRSAYLVTASLVPNDPNLYKVLLYRIVEQSSTECALALVQEVHFSRPVCGIQSVQMVKTKERTFALLIVNRQCPELLGGQPVSGPQTSNVLVRWWNPSSEQFDGSDHEEIAKTQKVTKISVLSKDLFVLQKLGEPSAILSTNLPLGTRLMATVRLNEQAYPSAAESANGDTYITHVTSAGAVVIDWISCVANQQQPSNFTLTRYSGSKYPSYENDADNSSYSIENSILANMDSQAPLRRSDRDSPRSWKIRHQGLSAASDLASTNVSTNATTAPSIPDGALHYEEIFSRDQHDYSVSLPGGGPANGQPDFFQRSHSEPNRMEISSGPGLPPPQPHQPLQQPNGPPQNGWQTAQNAYQQPMPMIYTPSNFNGAPQYPFVMPFGGPPQLPPGSTLAGYFTFPPVAIFAPVSPYPVPSGNPPYVQPQDQNALQNPHYPPPQQENVAPPWNLMNGGAPQMTGPAVPPVQADSAPFAPPPQMPPGPPQQMHGPYMWGPQTRVTDQRPPVPAVARVPTGVKNISQETTTSTVVPSKSVTWSLPPSTEALDTATLVSPSTPLSEEFSNTQESSTGVSAPTTDLKTETTADATTAETTIEASTQSTVESSTTSPAA